MTEAMPFLQKAILLSYDPPPVKGGILLMIEENVGTGVLDGPYANTWR